MSEDNPIVPKLVVELEGERAEFRAFSKPNQWALMENAKATKDGDATASLASTYSLAMTSVIPSERDRFGAFMMEHGQDEALEENLTNGLFALWNGETMLPLEPTSSDSSDSTGETGSTSTDDSSEPESSPDIHPTLEPYLAAVNGSSIPA
jgi:hypothetical protein